MRNNGELLCVFLSFFCRLGVATNLNMTLNDLDAGFFLKSDKTAPQYSVDDQNDHNLVMIVPAMHPLLLTSIRAEFGEFVTSENVERSVLKRTLGSERLHPSTIVEDMEISAHVVMQTILTDRPLLQVLFHGSMLPAFRIDARKRNARNVEPIRNASANYRLTMETKYCLTAHIQKDFNMLSSFCVLNGRTSICLAEVAIPHWWWNAGQTEYAQVYYSASILGQNSDCLDATYNQNGSIGNAEKNFISTVTLTHVQLSYEQLKEDQNVLVYIPQASFYPGSKFRVPVKLQPDSNLQIFVMKVKARHGIRVIGAEPVNSSSWKITLDLNHKLHGAMVTAFLADRNITQKNERVVDVFEWIFEVNEDASGEDKGRINLIVEYEMNIHQKEMYRSVENRIVAKVEIQRDNVFAIVPVIKTSELLNLAVLTGKMQTYPMRIYSITHTGRLNEVTPQTTCHSGDEEALKVVESCNWVYLDGTETRGSSSVTIITKYSRHTKFLFFQVWIPEIPLEVTVSDSLLSQIKGWRVPNQLTRLSRKTRGADFGILTHPGLLLQEEGIRKEDMAASCDLRYQSAILEVFASFSLADSPHSRYLVNRKAQFSITHLVQSQLRLTNSSVAILDGNVIEGIQPGRTEVQVVSKSGTVIGAAEVTVAMEKVAIEQLQVDIVSGLSISIDVMTEMQRTLVAHLKKTSQLYVKYQEAFLDISLRFDDGTGLPLHYIPHGEYYLDLDTLNNHVIAFGPSYSPDVPRVIALGQGKGELLKVAMELGELCQRKKSRPLAVNYAFVDVDFSKSAAETERVQNDAAQSGYDNNGKKVNTGRTSLTKSTKETLHLSLNYDEQPKGKSSEGDAGGKEVSSLEEVQSKHIGQGRSLTSLEVGMYTLLGVFLVAVFIFGINCSLFVTRYRNKKGPRDSKDPINCSPDWIWIGRDTLERNAINTACSQALMPEADFNGNHRGTLQPSSGESSSSSGNAGSNRELCVSNRNSYVSAYKGSECGIQMSNPLPDCNANILDGHTAMLPPPSGEGEVKPSAGGSISPQLTLSKMRPSVNDTKKSSKSVDSGDVSGIESPCQPAPVGGKMTREERFRHLEEAVASGSDVEWEYEALGVTYEELMEYFDNLKESTA